MQNHTWTCVIGFFVLIPNTCTTNPIYIGRAVCKSYSNVVRLLIVKLIMNNIKK